MKKNTMHVRMALVMVTMLFMVAGCKKLGLSLNTNTESDLSKNQGVSEQKQEDTAATQEQKALEKATSLLFTAQNNSGITGSAKIINSKGSAKVIIDLTGASVDTPQPAHIHLGSCANLGAVKYPLTNVVNGKSETTLSVPVGTLVAGLPLAVNVHKSAAEAGVYVACTDITKSSLTSSEEDNSDVRNTNENTNEDSNVNTNESADDNGGDTQGTVKKFEITGQNYSFSLKEIRVKKGDTVKIEFKNAEGFHNWVLDEFNAKTKTIQAGEQDEVTFVADRTGTFEYYCSVGQHRANGMKGNLIVE